MTAALQGCGAAAAALDPIPTQLLGAITGNDPAEMARFAKWLGRPQDQDLLFFNQESWEKLDASIGFIADVGRLVLAQKRRVMWSVPVGGAGGYESVRAGQRDKLYRSIADRILAAHGDGTSRICVRPPWEFNLATQSQAPKTTAGALDGKLYVAGYRRIAGIFRQASPRFYFDWCPNIGTGEIDPELCYPGDDLVDVVSVDVYYRGQYDDQGKTDAGASIFGYRKTQPHGLDWLEAFAGAHHKLIGLSEWGVDDDRATAFATGMADWIKRLGPRLSHHNYWDRTDGGVNARISDGGLPAIGAVYRKAFDTGPAERLSSAAGRGGQA